MNDQQHAGNQPTRADGATRLPAGVVDLEGEQPIVDAEVLAGRLGLTEAQLKLAMRSGHVIGRVERGDGADRGRWRLTFESANQRWGILVDRDGVCYETGWQASGPRRSLGRRRDAVGLYGGLKARRESVNGRQLRILRPLVRSLLLHAARRGEPVPEDLLLQRIEPFVHDVSTELLRRCLCLTTEEDARARRPLLSALVVSRDKDGGLYQTLDKAARRYPGGKHGPVAATSGNSWREQRRRALAFYGRH